MKKIFWILVLACASGNVLAQEKQSTLIKVEGKTFLEAIPKRMVVSIPLTTKDKTYATCNTLLMDLYAELIQDLKKSSSLGEQAIKTNNLSVREDYKWEDREQKLVGYVGSLNLIVKDEYSTKLLNDILGVLQLDKYNFGYSVNFILSEEQKKELTNKAIEQAVEDARIKAGILARSSGLKLQSILEIEYDVQEYSVRPEPLLRNTMMAEADAGSAEGLALSPKEIGLTKHVSVIWRAQKVE